MKRNLNIKRTLLASNINAKRFVNRQITNRMMHPDNRSQNTIFDNASVFEWKNIYIVIFLC